MKTPCINSILGKKSTVLLLILWRRKSCIFFWTWALQAVPEFKGQGTDDVCATSPSSSGFCSIPSHPPLSYLFSSLDSCSTLSCFSYGNHSKPLIMYIFFSEPLLIVLLCCVLCWTPKQSMLVKMGINTVANDVLRFVLYSFPSNF